MGFGGNRGQLWGSVSVWMSRAFAPCGLLLCAVLPAQAQFSLTSYRAADGTVYQVLSVPTGSLPSGVENLRITTVAGSVDGVVSCSSAAGVSGGPARAIAGVDTFVGTVHPFAQVLRTGF